jgi:hypothetical protein
VAFAAPLAGLVLLGAGCGGGPAAPSVASVGTTNSAAASNEPSASDAGRGSAATSFVAFAACMTSHGVSASTGPGGRGVEISAADPGSPQLQDAQAACRTLLPGGGPPTLSPAQEAERAKGLATFAGCMRRHGVPNFPDPNGQGQFPLGSIDQLDTNSTFFQAAYAACRSLFPKLGPQIRFP